MSTSAVVSTTRRSPLHQALLSVLREVTFPRFAYQSL